MHKDPVACLWRRAKTRGLISSSNVGLSLQLGGFRVLKLACDAAPGRERLMLAALHPASIRQVPSLQVNNCHAINQHM